MRAVCVLWSLLILAAGAAAQENLVRNGSFEADADGDGLPDHWRASGDRHVTQQLSLDRGRDGRRCARLRCTRFEARTPASHAMLCQMGVPVKRGRNYRVTLWARGEDIQADMVSIALSDTSVWANCGLEGAFAPRREWKQYEFIFRATRDCTQKSRLQIWFHSTGTLWIDDVRFQQAGHDLYRPGRVIPPGDRANLVPNASFECGADGWGSAEWDRTVHWGGNMNRLFGRIDRKEAYCGQMSLRIELSPENQPVSYFDYYELHRTPIRAPLAANMGFIQVQPGRPYTLSVYMKAARADTPALLAVRQFMGRSFQKSVRVSAHWRRYALTFKPTSRWCYVLAGPDLRRTDENPRPPEQALLWLDAVQLEQGDQPTAFQTRLPVEFAVWTQKPGNIFGWDEPVRFHLAVAGDSSPEYRQARVDIRLVDFFGNPLPKRLTGLMVRAGPRAEKEFVIQPSPQHRGFFRLHARMSSGGLVLERTIRLAVIPLYQDDDSRFGMNHAYPWPHLLELCGKAGLVWMRDWSLKWQQVEPQKGQFTFEEADRQIDRPLRHGLRVLGLLPFPSSRWSSSAPADYKLTASYISRRQHVAYAPRDVGQFENYVARTVSHYQGRIRWWQVFNEPVFTTYSLPRRFGYSAADYAYWTKAFARAARQANPDCKVLAGIGYLNAGQNLEDWEQFMAAGGLEAVDAVDIHHYPRLRPPEFIEGLLEKLGRMMERHGGRKPIWLTEYGYYADDEPWAVPLPSSGFNPPLESEQLQAAYAVRWATIMFAGGVEKIFYHAGTCDGINSDSLQGIFYEYAGQPHKIYAAQAVMAHLFTPACKFVRRLPLGEGVKGYLFRDGQRMLAVIWAPARARPKPIRLTGQKLQLWDIMGRPQQSGRFTPGSVPVYVLGQGLSQEAFQAALSVQ